MTLAGVLGGGKFEQKGHVVLVAFEGSIRMPNWCKNKGNVAGLLCSSFGVLWPLYQAWTWQHMGLWPSSIFGYLNLLFWPPSLILRPDFFSDKNISFQIKVLFEWLIWVSFEGAQIGVFRPGLLWVSLNGPNTCSWSGSTKHVIRLGHPGMSGKSFECVIMVLLLHETMT